MNDKNTSDNTVNKCGFWRGHNWNKWQEINRSAITRTRERKGEEVGISIIQERVCANCGFKKLLQQKVML